VSSVVVEEEDNDPTADKHTTGLMTPPWHWWSDFCVISWISASLDQFDVSSRIMKKFKASVLMVVKSTCNFSHMIVIISSCSFSKPFHHPPHFFGSWHVKGEKQSKQNARAFLVRFEMMIEDSASAGAWSSNRGFQACHSRAILALRKHRTVAIRLPWSYRGPRHVDERRSWRSWEHVAGSHLYV